MIGYRNGSRVSSLPYWARYLIAVGRFAVEHRLPGRRLVIGLSVPSRAYAAAFCALGVASAAYLDPEQHDPRVHFEYLAALPPGTALRYRHGTHLYCGRLTGVEQRYDEDWLAIGGYLRRWDKCSDIRPLEPGEPFVRRRPLTANPRFVAACATKIDPLAHASYTSLDCLLVGIKELLRPEVVNQEFVCLTNGALPSGVLNDLLRCDAFERNANDHDRTTVLSGLADDIPDLLRQAAPPAVVFDGASGYLRMRSHWRRSPWILVIDRTSPSAIPVGDAFNQELALSLEDADLSAAGELPAGFEVKAYYEVAR
jgi:hypothetical protein